MATYATFKHVELYNVGNTKKRVLKPPGGGSSDIFGGDNPSTPRSVKNRMQSNIFAAPSHSNGTNGAVKNGAADRRGKTNGDSHNRLFGEPDRQFTPAKNHMKSNIPIGGEKGAQTNGDHHATNGTNGTNGVAKTNGHHQNGGSSSSASSTNGDHVDHQVNGGSRTRENGNPVTGEGFKSEINTVVPSLNGANQVINKNRIPPGGFSSGLW